MRRANGGGVVRQRDVELTERQRQVLRLIAGGQDERRDRRGPRHQPRRREVARQRDPGEARRRDAGGGGGVVAAARAAAGPRLRRGLEALASIGGWRLAVSTIAVAAIAVGGVVLGSLCATRPQAPRVSHREPGRSSPRRSWSPTQTRPPSRTRIWSSSTPRNNARRIVASSAKGWRSIAWSPDSRFLAAVENGENRPDAPPVRSRRLVRENHAAAAQPPGVPAARVVVAGQLTVRAPHNAVRRIQDGSDRSRTFRWTVRPNHRPWRERGRLVEP